MPSRPFSQAILKSSAPAPENSSLIRIADRFGTVPPSASRPLLERLLPQILAVQEQQVEGVQDGTVRAMAIKIACSSANKDRPRSPDHRLAVVEGRAHLQACGRRGDRRETCRPVAAVAGADRRLPIGDIGGDAVAIPFDLMDPLRPNRRLVDEGWQAGPHPFQQRLIEQAGLGLATTARSATASRGASAFRFLGQRGETSLG